LFTYIPKSPDFTTPHTLQKPDVVCADIIWKSMEDRGEVSLSVGLPQVVLVDNLLLGFVI
jgi:hypothetical protein